jgi:CBS domain containing-hemolysin-like protein
MSAPAALVVAVVLLMLNAFFVGAEFAVISARRSQIEPLVDEGRRAARTTLWALEHVSLVLTIAQLGITMCSLGLGAVAEPAVAHLLERPFALARVPEGLLHPVSFTLALGVVIYLHVVLGEMVPKNLAISGPERAALLLAPPLVALARSLAPVVRALTAVTNGLLRVLRVEPKDELASAFTVAEVQSIVAESRREGLLDDEHELLRGALELGERRAGDVMVPLGSLVTVPLGCTPADVEQVVGRTGFSRFPVVLAGDVSPPAADGTDRDAMERDGRPSGPGIVGYLHVKDLLYADDHRHELPVPDKRIRGLVTVSATEELEDVLAAMQRSGAHLARVIDDVGANSGVVFLEDVLNELVGEVTDDTQHPEVPEREGRPSICAP